MKRIIAAPLRQLYYLQLENYELGRFLRVVRKSFAGETRTKVQWTPKLLVLTILAVGISVSFVTDAFTLFGSLGLIALPVVYLAFFAPLSIAVLLFMPFDMLAKNLTTHRASKHLRAHPKVKVIAVAGSYGKTTMKHALAEVLRTKMKVVVTPDSFNTPLGIARTVLSEVTGETEVLILEFGEHYPGDLSYLARNFLPDITLVTGINEAHLERFKTMEALINGIFEAIEGTKKNGLIILNADSKLVLDNYKLHLSGREVAFYSAEGRPESKYSVTRHEFDAEGMGQSFDIAEKGIVLVRLKIALLGGYAPGIAAASFIVGARLGLTSYEIQEGLENVRPVPHRLEAIRTNPSVLVIDDSYNGNPEGVRHAIETLARFKNRRKVYVTPGLVEGGVRTVRLHKDIGSSLANVADVVVLIRNSVTPHIEGGLLAKGFKKENIYWFDSAKDAHGRMREIVKPGDVVLFQNDWPDNYL